MGGAAGSQAALLRQGWGVTLLNSRSFSSLSAAAREIYRPLSLAALVADLAQKFGGANAMPTCSFMRACARHSLLERSRPLFARRVRVMRSTLSLSEEEVAAWNRAPCMPEPPYAEGTFARRVALFFRPMLCGGMHVGSILEFLVRVVGWELDSADAFRRARGCFRWMETIDSDGIIFPGARLAEAPRLEPPSMFARVLAGFPFFSAEGKATDSKAMMGYPCHSEPGGPGTMGSAGNPEELRRLGVGNSRLGPAFINVQFDVQPKFAEQRGPRCRFSGESHNRSPTRQELERRERVLKDCMEKWMVIKH